MGEGVQKLINRVQNVQTIKNCTWIKRDISKLMVIAIKLKVVSWINSLLKQITHMSNFPFFKFGFIPCSFPLVINEVNGAAKAVVLKSIIRWLIWQQSSPDLIGAQKEAFGLSTNPSLSAKFNI
ncbi:MAG: hypothetical protein M3O71_19300 [Bacteroidota bacterium]|nr:hypothetical protein [Bacteroidota bacterium]